jgi:hypothetical protein
VFFFKNSFCLEFLFCKPLLTGNISSLVEAHQLQDKQFTACHGQSEHQASCNLRRYQERHHSRCCPCDAQSSVPRRRISFCLIATVLLVAGGLVQFHGLVQVHGLVQFHQGPAGIQLFGDAPTTKEAVEVLEFLHIPKNGGSAIEKAAAEQARIVWGCCHWIDLHACLSLKNQVDLSGNRNVQIVPSRRSQFKRWGEPWHVPLQYFTVNPFHVLWNNVTVEQQQTTTTTTVKIFTIVRNPYTRAVSRYYCKWVGYKGLDKANVTVFNAWLQKIIKRQDGIQLLPQHLYVSNNTTQIVDHVLHFERLGQEFHALMNDYQLDIVLPEEKYNAGGRHVLSTANLTKQSIALINRVYAKDFASFGYDVL